MDSRGRISASFVEEVLKLFARYNLPISVEHSRLGPMQSLGVSSCDGLQWRVWVDEDGWFRRSAEDLDSVIAIGLQPIPTATQLALHIAFETLWAGLVDGHFADDDDEFLAPLVAGFSRMLDFVGLTSNNVAERGTVKELIQQAEQLEYIFGIELELPKLARSPKSVREEYFGVQPFVPNYDFIDEEVNPEIIPANPIIAGFAFEPMVAIVDDVPVGLRYDPAVWKKIRRQSVSATDARYLVRLNGKDRTSAARILDEKLSGYEIPFLEVFQRGIEREPVIAQKVQEMYPELSLVHNHALFVGENYRHVATPDMVGAGVLCEIKVSSATLSESLQKYSDQVQWQMHVTGAAWSILAVENRWTEALEFAEVERDGHRIKQLIEAADRFIEQYDVRSRDEYYEYEVGYYKDGWTSDVNSQAPVAAETSLIGSWIPQVRFVDAAPNATGEEMHNAALVTGDSQILHVEHNPIDYRTVENLWRLDDDEDYESEVVDESEFFVDVEPTHEFDGYVDFAEEQLQGATSQRAFVWTHKRRRKLLAKYLALPSLYSINLKNIDHKEAVAELTRLLLNPEGELVDPTAPRFGLTWTVRDYRKLKKLRLLGYDLNTIAKKMGRDQLGAAYVILDKHQPVVPPKLIKKYKLA